MSKSSSEVEEKSDSSSEKEESAEKKSNQKRNKNDKGRFKETPIPQENVGLVKSEQKRKREDEKLAKAESKKSKNDVKKFTKSAGVGGQTRGGVFTEKEVRTILQSLHNKQTDKTATDDFFRTYPNTTRTTQAVKNKVAKIRAELVSSLTEFEKTEASLNGIFSFFFHFFVSFFVSFLISSSLSPFSQQRNRTSPQISCTNCFHQH